MSKIVSCYNEAYSYKRYTVTQSELERLIYRLGIMLSMDNSNILEIRQARQSLIMILEAELYYVKYPR